SMESSVWFNPIQKWIYHCGAVIEIDPFMLQISPQNLQTIWGFAGNKPVQVQTTALPCESRFVGSAVVHFSAQIWRTRLDRRMQCYFCAGTCYRFRFQHPRPVT